MRIAQGEDSKETEIRNLGAAACLQQKGRHDRRPFSFSVAAALRGDEDVIV
jgi:hypothetical protein